MREATHIKTIRHSKVRSMDPFDPDDKIIVKFAGKRYTRKVKWKDLGNNEGYPYIIIKGKKVGIKE